MNYFELHIGDLTEAIAHLSILEDGVYGRLMRKYYSTERPLPSDVGQVQRLIGARTKDERQAVVDVLAEFFDLQDDGWHQSRCDAEIAEFHEKQANAPARKEGTKERQRRSRERRKALFDALRGHGVVPSYSTTTAVLQDMLSRVTNGDESRTVTPPVTRDVTATQSPVPKHQTPDTREEDTPPCPPPVADLGRNEPGTPPSITAGAVCKALRAAGIARVSPSNQTLLALLQAGATQDELVEIAPRAIDKGDPFTWLLTVAVNNRTKAAETAKTIHRGPLPQAPPPRQSATERQIATMNALTGKDRNHDRQRAPPADTIDIAVRVVP